MSTVALAPKLSFDEARELTTQIKSSVENVWTLLLQAHEGNAASALGYPSWQEYVRVEFQMSRVRAHQLMDFAKVRENLGDTLTTVNVGEFTTRPLAALKEPEQQREAWQAAVEATDGKPTAKDVEAAVETVKAKASPETKPKLPRYVPSDAMQYAEMAIGNLQKIQPNDTQREAAFQRVEQWLSDNR